VCLNEIKFPLGVTVQFPHEFLAISFVLVAKRQADCFVTLWFFKVSGDFIYNFDRMSSFKCLIALTSSYPLVKICFAW